MQINLEKYDETVTNLIKENIDLEEQYKNDKKIYDRFLLDYEEKEVEYFKVVVEKEEILEAQRLEQIKSFLQNHSARVIQRFWRKYMERTRAARQSKKSKSKGKNKVKSKSKK